MSDRELLELAAKAAGIECKGSEMHPKFGFYLKSGLMWNPLTDDGDALRLAVKLNLQISYDVNPDDAFVQVTSCIRRAFNRRNYPVNADDFRDYVSTVIAAHEAKRP